MKHLLLFLLSFFCLVNVKAQQRQEFVKDMNSAFDNKSEMLKFYEKTGTLEQKDMGVLYRFSLSDIASIKEKVVEQNCIINVYCSDNNCFTVYRNDSNVNHLSNYAFFFSSAEKAFVFARNLGLLVNTYLPEGKKVELDLINTPNASEKNQPSSVEAEKKEKDGLDSYLEQQEEKVQAAKPENKTTSSVKKKTDAEEEDTEEEVSGSSKAVSAKEHMEQIKADREEKQQQRKSDFDDKKEQDKAAKEELREKIQAEREAQREEQASQKSNKKSKAQEEREDVGGLVKEEDGEEKSGDKRNEVLCKQLDQILKSCAGSQFKSIEGTETNTVKHINESKVKWKGARKSYLTNYKGKRTFIAELKSSKDFELLQIEYDQLQTDLENCLGASWEFSDKSNDEEYADFNGEIRDNEYHYTEGNAPNIRIILISDNDKYTLFVRIQ